MAKHYLKKIKVPTLAQYISIYSFNGQSVLRLDTPKEKYYIKIPLFTDCKKDTNYLILSCTNKKGFLTFESFALFFNTLLKSIEKPFKKKLLLKGLGFKATLVENNSIIEFKLGFSHLIHIKVPTKSVQVLIEKGTISIEGVDRVAVGNFALKLKNLRLPDSYKGKGFWYKNEIMVLKAVKKA